MSLTIGIDDAGRGPIIGPMILSGILVDENSLQILKKYNIKDSKQLLQNARIELAKVIKSSALSYHTVSVSPKEIDSALQSDRLNLNTLEAIKAAEIINELNDKKQKIKVIIDCPSTNTKKWKSDLLNYIENPQNLDIKCEHKADENHIEAAAASILAKVKREEEVSKIKEKYPDIGSGYPSDPNTKAFLKSQGKKIGDTGIIRKTWKTWTNLHPEDKIKKGQASLTDF
ncbi:ribonuclease HII [Candidatus Pacearchaeota archaeon]|nr:ribonuclease HII [Candidatus Pacearchaeota archaeon]|tara:strand:+ start:7713 stop:8399 length:687 start_codon:yes stop_codon:yes gene_type:complete